MNETLVSIDRKLFDRSHFIGWAGSELESRLPAEVTEVSDCDKRDVQTAIIA